MRELAVAETNRVTAAPAVRAAGLTDLDREIDRARRGAGPLVVAYVAGVDPKAGDAHGLGDRDALLLCAIRARLRSYDLIVSVDGDALLCLISGATIGVARTRFASVQAALATGRDPCEVDVGFAALSPNDSATTLIARAEADHDLTAAPD
jgi:hypothetical protein